MTRALFILGRGAIGGVVGALVAPLAAFVVTFATIQFASTCHAPSDSGGCYMGLVSAPLAAIVPGALLGFAFAAFRAWRAGP